MLLGLHGKRVFEILGRRSVLKGTMRLFVLLLVALTVQFNTPALADQIRYVYDEAGRLVQATSSDGSGTAYRYDEIGNILSVKRITAGAVVISEFSPNSGTSGTQVAIFGSGFDEVATNNAVTFNGASAVVLSATKTKLTVSVPSNATTGKINVSNSNGTATSGSDFVIATDKSPSITSFTPAMGPVGAAITITGTNFGAQPAANKVKLGEYLASTISASVTQVVTSAPTISASGRISVSTAWGKAVSANDFFALPPGISAADVVYTGRLVAGGGAQTVQIGAAGKRAILLFDGSVKQMLSLVSVAGTFSSSPALTVYGPDGRTVVSGSIRNDDYFDFPALPVFGTYTIMLTAPVAGKVDLQLKLADTGTLLIDGAAKLANLGSKQNGYYTFAGEAGQYLGLGYTDLSMNPGGSMSYTVLKPDGSQLFADTWSNNNSNNLPMLPVTGTYTLVVDPPTISTASLNVWLSKDIPGQLAFGQAMTMSSSRVGQNFRLTFSGVAGERYWLALNGNTLSSANVNVVQPDGAVLTKSSISTSAKNFEIPALPTTGTYSIFIDPDATVTGKVDVQINQLPDIRGPIDINGPAVPLELGVLQRAMLTFNGIAGQRLGLGYANVTTNPASQPIYYTVLKPDGSQLFADYWSNSNSNNLPALPVSGTYTIKVQSGNSSTSSLSLLLSSEMTGTLVPDAAPLNVNLTRIGQNARLTFDAVAGRHYWLKLRGGTFPSPVSMYVYKPDGSTLISTSVSASQDFDTGVLQVSGTYTIWIDPSSAVAGKVDAELVTIPDDFVSAIEINGPAVPVSLSVRQRATLTFNGTAGQHLWLKLRNGTFPSAVSVYIYKPDGSTLNTTSVSTSRDLDLGVLPVSGTYAIWFDPPSTVAGKVDVALETIPDDFVSSIEVNGAAVPISLGARQRAMLSFNGIAGQRLGLGYANVSTNPASQSVYYTVLKPDGSQLFADNWSNSNSNNLPALPASGTYTIKVEASAFATTSLSLLLSGDVTGTLVPDAAPLNVNVARIGQNARLTFDAVAGQYYWLRLRGVTFPNSVSTYIYKPDGSTLTDTAISSSQDFDIGILPVSGTYSVWLDPTTTVTGKVDLELATIPADAVDTITADGGAAPINLAASQRAVLRFDGVAGQRLGLGYTGVSTIPASSNIYYTVTKPDGTQLFTDYWSNNNSNDLPALPTNGTYTVAVRPAYLASAMTTVWLSTDVARTLVQNDPATTVSIARVGQNARLTFNGVTGQAYTLRFTDGTFPSSVSVTVLNPNGSSLSSTSVSSSATLNLPALATTGIYSVFIGPSNTTTGQVSVQLQ